MIVLLIILGLAVAWVVLSGWSAEAAPPLVVTGEGDDDAAEGGDGDDGSVLWDVLEFLVGLIT